MELFKKAAALRECAKDEAIKAGIAGGGLLSATLGKKELKNALNGLDSPTSDDVGDAPANFELNTEKDLFTSGNVSVGDTSIE